MPFAPDLSGSALDDRYELHAVIGEGAFGRVYRGLDRRLARQVAVKVIKPWWTEDPEWVTAFQRETRMLARLSHPGIVQIYDVGHAPEGLYYVSELVEGEDLAQRLRRGPVGIDEAATIALGLCRALAGAHRVGEAVSIVHRDVKPANVLLAGGPGDDLRVKVGDFGVARLAEGTTHEHHPSVVVGTPKYMAPEQGSGAPTTPATDVYSVGVVLYEMLAGRPPFHADSAVALAVAHLQDPPPPLGAEIDEELAAVVARALSKDPARRYRDAGAMADALERARSNAPVLVGAGATANGGTGAGPRSPIARPPGPGAPPRRPGAPPRHPGAPPRHPGAPPRRLGTPPPDPVETGSPDATRPAPRLSPRTDVHPAARRRAIALFGLAVVVLAALIAAAVLTGHDGRRARAAAAAAVEVPLLVGEDRTDATARLRRLGLRVSVAAVPAPGIAPGTVTSQAPVAGHSAPARSTVALSVSETPRWRTVTTFSGRDSTSFRISGARWRLVSTVSHASHCTLLVFCNGSSAQVTRSTGPAVDTVGLGDGSAQTHVLTSGPGVYRVRVSPASGDTRWSIAVQDDY